MRFLVRVLHQSRDKKMKGEIALATGVKNVLKLKTEDIAVWDWAWGLKRQIRWSGATVEPWDVLSHSWLVRDLALDERDITPEQEIMLLCHDATEGYLCDLPRPLKHIPEAKFFRDIEDDIAAAIFQRLGIKPDWTFINRYDKQALYLEWVRLFDGELGDRVKPVYEGGYDVEHRLITPQQYIRRMKDLCQLANVVDLDELFREPYWKTR